jgi:bacteriocin-like protein
MNMNKFDNETTRELTDAELNTVSGGVIMSTIKSVEKVTSRIADAAGALASVIATMSGKTSPFGC